MTTEINSLRESPDQWGERMDNMFLAPGDRTYKLTSFVSEVMTPIKPYFPPDEVITQEHRDECIQQIVSLQEELLKLAAEAGEGSVPRPWGFKKWLIWQSSGSGEILKVAEIEAVYREYLNPGNRESKSRQITWAHAFPGVEKKGRPYMRKEIVDSIFVTPEIKAKSFLANEQLQNTILARIKQKTKIKNFTLYNNPDGCTNWMLGIVNLMTVEEAKASNQRLREELIKMEKAEKKRIEKRNRELTESEEEQMVE